MANLASIVRPYARAVFAQALEDGQLDAWQQRLGVLAQALDDPQLVRVIHSQVISKAQKSAALNTALASEPELNRLAQLLVANGRLETAGELARQYDALRREHQHLQAVTISSPYPLDEASIKQLAARLEERIGSKLEVHTRVDPDLIAGVRIDGENWMIDSNMKAQLAQLTRRLVA